MNHYHSILLSYSADDRGLITTNGGSTDKFSWSQNRYEVTVQAILPAGTKASELV